MTDAERIDEPRKQMVRLLEVMQEIPLRNTAANLGREVSPLLAEITGLSPARIAQGNLDRIRVSTMVQVEARTAEWVAEHGARNGYPPDEVERRLRETPMCSNGEVGSYSGWIYSYETEEMRLPGTIGAGLEIDELLLSLKAFAATDNLISFLEAFETYEHTSATRLAGDIPPEWLKVPDWHIGVDYAQKRFMSVLWRVYAFLDAEWGGQYFKLMEPEPIFLFVTPLVDEALLSGRPSHTRRNIIKRPVRRLLEFSHALAYRAYKKRWPTKPVSRAELGRLLVEASEHVGNYFDGTRKLTTRVYQNQWIHLCEEFSGVREGQALVASPFVVASVAIGWQKLLLSTTVDKKILSLVIPDVDSYRVCWKYFYDQLHPNPEPHVAQWPAWLVGASARHT